MRVGDKMILSFSAEVYQPAFHNLHRSSQNVESYLNVALANSNLRTLHCELRYVPIVMPEDMFENYPERSKLRKKQKLYDCAPILNYDVFVNGTFEDQLQEYLRGIALSTSYLSELGASLEQVKTFKEILDNAVERILIEQPAETRH